MSELETTIRTETRTDLHCEECGSEQIVETWFSDGSFIVDCNNGHVLETGSL